MPSFACVLKPLSLLGLALGCAAPVQAAVSWSVGFSGGDCRPHYQHHHYHHGHHGHSHLGWSVQFGRSYHADCNRVHVPPCTTRVVTPCHTTSVPPCTTVVVAPPPACPPAQVVVTAVPACRTAAYITYHGNGQMSVRGQLRDGLRDGNWTWFDSRGVMSQQGSYIRGIRQGLWVRYDAAGRVAYQATYEDGRLVNETVYNAACGCLVE